MNYDINHLNTIEKVGQLMMFGFDGTVLNDHAIKLIKDYQIGNVILFARNCESPEQLFHLNQNLQKLAMESIGIPLLISIDQEGGMVTRIFNGSTFFPGAMTIAATNRQDFAYEMGDLMGRELDLLGINMNLAPVLDVNNNYKNPVIGVRSYSDDPIKVAEYGLSFMKGLQNHVIATAKHFPGHGDTQIDSHLGLPRINHSVERLEKIELYPFKEAIKANIKAIMSSHIDFPYLTEKGLPVTLSKKCLTSYLRETLGFEGLLISDGMNMKAIETHYGTVEASLMAVEAGINIVCVCHEIEDQIGARNRILKAVLENQLSMELLNERVSRVLKYKSELKPINFNLSYQDVSSIVESDQTKKKSYEIVKKAMTLVKGKPFKQCSGALFIGLLPKATSGADDVDHPYNVNLQIHKHMKNIDTVSMSIDPNEREIEKLITRAQSYDQIIVTTYNSNIYLSQINFVEKLIQLDKDLHVVSFRNPYDLYFLKSIKNYVCLYEYTPNSIKVLIEYLKGDLIPEGRIPVKYE
jgi:beta-N-acetylhexosaminidase